MSKKQHYREYMHYKHCLRYQNSRGSNTSAPNFQEPIWCWHLIWQLTKNSNGKHFKVLEREIYFWQYTGERELKLKFEKHHMVNVTSKSPFMINQKAVNSTREQVPSQTWLRIFMTVWLQNECAWENKCTICTGWNYIRLSSWPMGFSATAFRERGEKQTKRK